MSNSTFNSEYLYNLPAAVVHEFTRVMDSLPYSDWQRFASQVICDQTELRLLEQSGRRTETLIHKWGCRNGTVGDLITVLQDLELFRPRDIILKWRRIPQLSSTSPSSLPPPSLTHSSSPSSSLFTPSKDFTRALSNLESKLLPRTGTGPPPPDLPRTCPCPPSTVLKESKKEERSYDSCAVKSPPFTGVMCWPFNEVQRGTDNFSAARQIGEGGFGHVYRASMRNTDFAVKRLKEDSHMGWSVVKESFKTEVERLSQYRHPNIMDLVGYSVEGGAYCLIYVYMPSGSLEDRLHCESGSALSWSQRVKVVLGSAKAIQYLHSCSPALIHGDVKSSNILLGEHLDPKLSDFGLARLCRNPSRTPGKTSSVAQTSTVRGTLAYLPDEYLKDGQLGMEIDVYSFGVVLLEVLTGRRALETSSQSKNVYLKDLVSELEDDGKSCSRSKDTRELSNSQAAENIWKKHLDPWLMTDATPGPHRSKEIAQLACRCLDRRRKKRPPMTEVFDTLLDVHTGLEALNGRVTVRTSPSPPPPPPPPHLSCPMPLRSDKSVDSLSRQFSKLGPQENTFCCSHNHSFPRPPSAVTCSDLPESRKSEESWDSRYSSSRVPCESDESQGYSQYLVPACTAQGNTSQLWPEGNGHIKNTQSSSFSGVLPEPSSVASDDRVIINPFRQRLVEKMALYEEGRILTSDLFSSGSASNGAMNTRPQEPEESDEFASSLA
ncbi:interleukin-1 receptor-associated kinase 1 isoform X2 [Ictalurus punctatus]|uniref:Interleukin-1 receptor-associated kinase 1 isoform X2 n=1 Tax=Ictalurus punctatus TaxID=7998 RepID=A0A2D0R070_ICTPU|nr:interleukin-1 receptor-associated kinase 1 isoform X2 [Ictalurus punctatus]